MSDGDLELRIAWERYVGQSAVAAAELDAVVARYREAHRRYHTVRHLTWVVRHVGELAGGRDLDDIDAVVAAAFYHDAVYDPHASDNEAVSADLARHSLTRCGWAPDRSDLVAQLIEGTATHDVDGATLDAAVLYAADLGVLAAPPAKYGDYVRNVRHEYAHVGEELWADGRSRVLRSFLDRPAIYAPVLELGSWETRARANITAELRALGR